VCRKYHSYGSFGRTNKNIPRVKENENSRNITLQFHCIHACYTIELYVVVTSKDPHYVAEISSSV
jgi:hypothetical protein